MEVHHHSHSSRKKWTHYFWEFLMLFLAVTLGFFVENQREHYIEKQRAKEFAKSMVADLELDVYSLGNIIKEYDSAARNVDSFLHIVRSTNLQAVPGGKIYYYGDAANSGYRMAFNTATLEQLKSSGSLRYFPIKIRNKISKYDQFMQEFNLRQNNEPLFNIETKKYFEKIFDNSVLGILYKTQVPDSLEKFRLTDYDLMNDDIVLLREYANNCFLRKENWRSRITTALIPLRNRAAELIEILKKEYRLK
jgi:hypothetical protein